VANQHIEAVVTHPDLPAAVPSEEAASLSLFPAVCHHHFAGDY